MGKRVVICGGTFNGAYVRPTAPCAHRREVIYTGRTTETATREVIQTSLTSSQVKAFIEDASLWITEEIVTPSPVLFSPARLEIVERYLTCALIRTRDLGLHQATMSDISEFYQADATVSDYLLRAASFDPTNKIRENFLAPKPISARIPPARPVQFAVGDGFVDTETKQINTDMVPWGTSSG